MPEFCLNLGFFHTDHPLERRFARAADDGFSAVELFWPRQVTGPALRRAADDAGVSIVSFNMDEGDYENGERGRTCRPEAVRWWRVALETALETATATRCPRITLLAGDVAPGEDRSRCRGVLLDNLAWAAPLAEAAGIRLMIEPLAALTHPHYLLPRTDDVLAVLDDLGSPAVALQFDVFQAQTGEGNVVATLRRVLDRVEHVQIAEVPGRGAPGTGELDFRFVLGELDRLGYDGWVGLEYLPPEHDPFAWMAELATTLP